MKFLSGEKFPLGWESLIRVEAEAVTFQSFRFHWKGTASTASASSFRFRFRIPAPARTPLARNRTRIWVLSFHRKLHCSHSLLFHGRHVMGSPQNSGRKVWHTSALRKNTWKIPQLITLPLQITVSPTQLPTWGVATEKEYLNILSFPK